jgi:PAS domain S-box-containing protein
VVVRWLLHPILQDDAPLLIFVLPVFLAAWYGGFGPGLLATALATVVGVYLFVRPAYSLRLNTAADVVRVLIFVGEGLAITWVCGVVERSGRRARESEERFRLMVEGVRDYAIFMLEPDGRVASWNAGAERIKGYAAAEIVGRHFSTFYPPEDVAAGKPARELELAAGDGSYREEGWRVRRDGSRFWASVVLTPLRRPDGTLRGFAKVTRDETERKAAEDAVRAAAADLERRVTERTAELTEANAQMEAFTYTISHDLRAPLRGMQGFAQAVIEDYSDKLDETGQLYLSRIAAAGERMQGLIEDLLAYSRLRRAQLALQAVGLAGVVEEAVRGPAEEARGRGGAVEVAGAFPDVVGHRATLVQVVLNLVANAVKFTREGAPPRVRVWAEPRGGGSRVRLWVGDEGIGVAPEHHGRIFNVFERLHSADNYRGTGVGLAIVRAGVERMGGAAGVESDVDRGSRFWIELDAALE